MLALNTYAFFVAVSVALLSAATATTAVAGSEGSGLVEGVCAHVVGLAPGEKHFAACVESLTRSADGLRRSSVLAAARERCLAQGAASGAAALAECELEAPGSPAATGGPGGATPIPGGSSRSYFAVSRRIAFERDQLACARLGFEPARGGFDDCVADLRAALAQASTSMM